VGRVVVGWRGGEVVVWWCVVVEWWGSREVISCAGRGCVCFRGRATSLWSLRAFWFLGVLRGPWGTRVASGARFFSGWGGVGEGGGGEEEGRGQSNGGKGGEGGEAEEGGKPS